MRYFEGQYGILKGNTVLDESNYDTLRGNIVL